MTGFAVAVGLGYLTIVLFVISAIVAGWRNSWRALIAILVLAAILLAFWLWFIVGVSPIEPSALMSLLSVQLAGGGSFLIGAFATRLFRRGKHTSASRDEA